MRSLISGSVSRVLGASLRRGVTQKTVQAPMTKAHIGRRIAAVAAGCGCVSTTPKNTRLFSEAASVYEVEDTLLSREVVDVVSQPAQKKVTVTFADGTVGDCFAYISLRDSCGCEKCWHPTAHQRLFTSFHSVPLDIKPQSVSAENGGVKIVWEDGHESFYSHKWLRMRVQLSKKKGAEKKTIAGDDFYWNASNMTIPRHDFKKVTTDDGAMQSWAGDLIRTGLTVLSNCGVEKGAVTKLANSVAYIRVQHYGPTFEVESKADPSHLAYTNLDLDPHTDIAWFQYPPGVQMLHCMKQATYGGENTYVDGFAVADELKRVRPDAWEILTTMPVSFTDIGEEAFKWNFVYDRPIITLDSNGNYKHIVHSDHARATYMRGYETADALNDFYEAYFTWTKMLNSPDFQIRYKLKPGEMAAFYNNRVLHGRKAFEMTANAASSDEPITVERHFQGAYFDLDELKSKYRVATLGSDNIFGSQSPYYHAEENACLFAP